MGLARRRPSLAAAGVLGAFCVLAAALALGVVGRRSEPQGPTAAAPAAGERPAASLLPAGGAPELAPCAGPAPRPAREEFEQRVVELVNRERRAAGLPPLKRVEPLTESARWYARDMAVKDYFAEDHDTHYRSHGRLVRGCDWRDRIGWFYDGWTALAENIAAGYETPEEVVEGWMASPGHRTKMMGRGHWETGAGYWGGGSEGHYWVQDFGRRDGSFPVVIQDEAARTGSRRVAVYVYGSWREMRVRNDEDGPGPWRTFSSDFEWVLKDQDGPRTITVDLRDGRLAASSSDTIVLRSGSGS